jgi:hypothetical protein
VLGVEGADGARVRVAEQPGGLRVKAEPAGSEHPLRVAVTDQGDVSQG